MADPVLKFPPEQKGNPPEPCPSHRRAAAPPPVAGMRVSAYASAGGAAAGRADRRRGFYLNGGRYVTTDDAYVGAQKVLITPDISGKIEQVVVREGQHVKKGDVLFDIDPVPFRLALQQAKATLDQAKTNYDNLVGNIKIYGQMAELAQQGVDLKQRDVDRKSSLVKSAFGSQLDLDNSSTGLVTAKPQLQFLKQQPRARKPSCSAIPICRSNNFRPTRRPRRRWTRPSATSITP